MKLKSIFVLLITFQIMSGCSVLDKSVVTDSLTTVAGISSGAGAEANPLFKGASGIEAALGTSAVTYAVIHAARKTLSPNNCAAVYKTASSSKYGATVNNVLLIAGVSSGWSIPAGIVAAKMASNDTALQKDADVFCQVPEQFEVIDSNTVFNTKTGETVYIAH